MAFMTPRVNPFRPNSPVNPVMFVGRDRELKRLSQHLVQTSAGEPTNFMITGERGIGKSSLMLYVSVLATGLLTVDDNRFRLLVLNIDIDSRTTHAYLAKRLHLALEKQLAKAEPARDFLGKAWAFIQRLEVPVVAIKEGKAPDEGLIIDELAYSLAELMARVSAVDGESLFGARYDGLLVLMDEADSAPAHLQLGVLLKQLLERLQRAGCNRVMFGLAGLPRLRDVLFQSHPSALRLFEEIHLERLNRGEVSRAIDTCLAIANRQNTQQTAITDLARVLLTNLSEGYPHFLQQFGYSAFAVDTDGVIDDEDVWNGALGAGKGLEQIGTRYYHDNYYSKIWKDSYRQVLRIMADRLDDWVTKQDIKKKFKGKESVLNNAIHALRERDIIISKEGEKGVYRLENKGFGLWIKLNTKPLEQLQKDVAPNR